MEEKQYSPTQILYREFMTFNLRWDSYSCEERDLKIKDFQQRLLELENNPRTQIAKTREERNIQTFKYVLINYSEHFQHYHHDQN